MLLLAASEFLFHSLQLLRIQSSSEGGSVTEDAKTTWQNGDSRSELEKLDSGDLTSTEWTDR